MSTRAVLYARVSGDDRNTDGRNLASQLEICREYARSRGYTVVAELCEDERGASGADFDLPKLQDALEMARERAFDVLVARELDRLARSLAKQLFFETQFKQAGVAVEYALASYEESPEGQLTKNVRAIIAEYERLKILERMVRGRRNKIKTGSVHVAGRPPYGYDLAEEDGKYHLAINESEAQVVRMIYGWYTEGDGESGVMGVSKITHKLTDMGIPTFADRRPWQGVSKQRDRGVWARSTVIRMLKSETYAGLWRYGKDGDSGELLEVEVPAIVSREVWEAAQAQRARNRTNAKRNRKYNYLMGRRVTCGRCNHKMLSHSVSFSNKPLYLYYACPAVYKKRDYEHPCDLPSFRAEDVDASVWEWIEKQVLDPEELAKGLEKQQARQDEELAPLHERVETIDAQLAEQKSQLERLLDLFLSGEFPKEMLTERRTRIEGMMEALEQERSALVTRLEAEALTKEQILSLQDFASRIAESWRTAGDAFETRREIVEMIDLHVTLENENGQQRVHVRCHLGKDSFLIATKSTPGSGRRTSRKGRDSWRQSAQKAHKRPLAIPFCAMVDLYCTQLPYVPANWTTTESYLPYAVRYPDPPFPLFTCIILPKRI